MNQRYRAPKDAPAPIGKTALIPQINKCIPQLKLLLPMSADRFARLVITEVQKNPRLAECSPESFFGAMFEAAQLGLEPGGGMGLVYLVPKNIKGTMQVQLMVGYQGMLQTAENNRDILVSGHAVHENDFFEYEEGSSPRVVHRIPLNNRGQLVATYAMARYRDGDKGFHSAGPFKSYICDLEEIDAARKKSDNKSEYGPWATSFKSMAIKTAIRRLYKQLPKTERMARVLELEERSEMGLAQDFRIPTEAAKSLSIDVETAPAQITLDSTKPLDQPDPDMDWVIEDEEPEVKA